MVPRSTISATFPFPSENSVMVRTSSVLGDKATECRAPHEHKNTICAIKISDLSQNILQLSYDSSAKIQKITQLFVTLQANSYDNEKSITRRTYAYGGIRTCLQQSAGDGQSCCRQGAGGIGHHRAWPKGSRHMSTVVFQKYVRSASPDVRHTPVDGVRDEHPRH